MAGSYIGKYDTTAANNTATGTGSVSIAEGMLPSNVNNAMRDIMADIRQWYNSAEWIEYGMEQEHIHLLMHQEQVLQLQVQM